METQAELNAPMETVDKSKRSANWTLGFFSFLMLGSLADLYAVERLITSRPSLGGVWVHLWVTIPWLAIVSTGFEIARYERRKELKLSIANSLLNGLGILALITYQIMQQFAAAR